MLAVLGDSGHKGQDDESAKALLKAYRITGADEQRGTQRSQTAEQHGTGYWCCTVPIFEPSVPYCTALFGSCVGTIGTANEIVEQRQGPPN